MNGKDKERWQELCELAAKEQDPNKLLELTQEIERLLRAKQKKPPRPDSPPKENP